MANMIAPLSASDIDLRFIERDGKRILQWRRADLSKHQHRIAVGPHGSAVPAYADPTTAFVWAYWQDVRIDPSKGESPA
jgi:hypothetical protein